MSSKRRIQSSRRNGAKSHGPSTPEGKKRSAQNAMHHGLLAQCVLLTCEKAEVFDALVQQHVEYLQPAGGVEFGMIEEMAAAKWRLHRTWALQVQMFEKEIGLQPPGDDVNRMANAFDILAISPARAVLDRYETRFQLTYQRALRSLQLLRSLAPSQPNDDLPNEPSPISEQPANDPQPPDSKPLSGAANPGCSRLSAGPRALPKPPALQPVARPVPKEPRAAA